MRIIFRGGYNVTDYSSLKNNILFERGIDLQSELESGRKIVIVTAAKPDGDYDRMIRPLVARGATEVNQSFQGDIDWPNYDWIIVMGGKNAPLLAKLKESDFSFDKLKDTATYIGDSAGTMVQAAFYYVYDNEAREVTFHEGLMPYEKRIFIVHANNSHYVDDFLRSEVEKFAQKESLEVIEIDENEEKKL